MVRQVIKFQATDGNVFDTEHDANIHDIKLKFEEVKKLAFVEANMEFY